VDMQICCDQGAVTWDYPRGGFGLYIVWIDSRTICINAPLDALSLSVVAKIPFGFLNATVSPHGIDRCGR